MIINVLNYNLLSISQLCDNGCIVEFKNDFCTILDGASGRTIFVANCVRNTYVLYLDKLVANDDKNLALHNDNGYLWHKRF